MLAHLIAVHKLMENHDIAFEGIKSFSGDDTGGLVSIEIQAESRLNAFRYPHPDRCLLDKDVSCLRRVKVENIEMVLFHDGDRKKSVQERMDIFNVALDGKYFL